MIRDDYPLKYIKSNRKSISIQINSDLTITVRVPNRVTQKEIDRILQEKEPWIKKHLEIMRDRMAKADETHMPKLTGEEIKLLADRALKYIPERVAFFSKIVGVDYGRITIRNQKTRWGSCSSKGNLNFNCLLMLTPPEVIDYVVVHELCHRRQMNHSKAFWDEVEKVLPNYKLCRKWLKTEGSVIMQRV